MCEGACCVVFAWFSCATGAFVCSAVQLAGGGARLRSRALLYFSLCEEAQPSEMCVSGFLVCVCVECVRMFEVWRRERREERGKARAICLFKFSPVGFCALPAVVNFSASLCCHVLFPVDHALLLPPPQLYSPPFPHYSHTLSSVCVGLHRWAGAPAEAA